MTEFEIGKLDIVGNVMIAGPNTQQNLPLLLLEGIGDVDVRMVDNVNVAPRWSSRTDDCRQSGRERQNRAA
jgi:hypothetical protein